MFERNRNCIKYDIRLIHQDRRNTLHDHIILIISYCCCGDFSWKSKVPRAGAFRAVQQVNSCEVGTSFLDEVSDAEFTSQHVQGFMF